MKTLVEGFALYMYQVLTCSTRLKNNWKSKVATMKLAPEFQPFVDLIRDCLNAASRPTSAQLVSRLTSLSQEKMYMQ
jgi:hypothetical protein